jgi:hypothetical protein
MQMISLDEPLSSDTGKTYVMFPNAEHMKWHHVPPDQLGKQVCRRRSARHFPDRCGAVRRGCAKWRSSLVLSAEGPGWIGRSKPYNLGVPKTSSGRVVFKKDMEVYQ